jgi:hypothetical protein
MSLLAFFSIFLPMTWIVHVTDARQTKRRKDQGVMNDKQFAFYLLS